MTQPVVRFEVERHYGGCVDVPAVFDTEAEAQADADARNGVDEAGKLLPSTHVRSSYPFWHRVRMRAV